MIAKLHYISQENEQSTHLENIALALEAGCKWIQLRIKNQEKELVLEQALKARLLCDQYQAKLIINDFPSVAFKAKADGLHLGLSDMSIKKAREIIDSKIIIGGTANTIEDIIQRKDEGADYIGLGPFRFTTTKENLSPVLGLMGYQNILNEMKKLQINIPIIAIGGIVLEDIPELISCGVHGIALSGAITNADDKKSKIENINNLIDRSLIESI